MHRGLTINGRWSDRQESILAFSHKVNGLPLQLKYVFENSLSLDAQLGLVQELAKVLRDGEKVLVLSPARVVVAHAAGITRDLEKLVAAQGRKFIIKESEFGKASRNLYTFIEF